MVCERRCVPYMDWLIWLASSDLSYAIIIVLHIHLHTDEWTKRGVSLLLQHVSS